MEEIELIKGDSSDLYEFSSKQVSELDTTWEGSWVVSASLGGTPVINGGLVKNKDVLNDDSLEGEEFEKTYKIFKGKGTELIEFNDDVVTGDTAIVSGNMYTLNADGETHDPVADTYVYVTIKGIFSGYSRTELVKTDVNGDFTINFSLAKTVKIPADSYFIFQILPTDSVQLTGKTYYVSVEIRQRDDQSNLIFRKEVLRAKLRMQEQGVIST
jgi:hypothetical protein